MQRDEIREQIEALRQEVRGLSTSILNLRQDDMRKVFGDQIRPVLTDRIARHYSRVPKRSTESGQELTQKELLDLVDQSVTVFQHDGKQKALRFIDDFEQIMVAKVENEDRTNIFELQIISQIREYFDLSDTIFNKTVSDVPNLPSVETSLAKATPSPESVERLLAPLSNARRVQVMLILSRESNSLAELCKELDLQKGHLQFHLKALVNVDYIRFDRKSRLYSVTARGTQMLDGICRVIRDLSIEE